MKTKTVSFAALQKQIMKKVEKKKIRRWKLVEKDSKTHRSLMLIYGVLSFLILTLFGFLFCHHVNGFYSSLPVVNLLSVLISLFFLICIKDSNLPCIQILSKSQRGREWRESTITFREEIRSLIEQETNKLLEDLLGGKSDFQKHLMEITKEITSALAVREQLLMRARSYETIPERIETTLTDLDDAIQRLESDRNHLEEFRGKVNAFIQECRQSLNRVDPILHELELIRKARLFSNASDERERETERVIQNTTAELCARLHKLQTQLTIEIASIGQIMITRIDRGSAEKDIQLMEQVSRELVKSLS